MILCIDAGNTRIKWGMHHGGAWLGKGAAEHAEVPQLLHAWRALGTPARIVVANVAEERVRASLAEQIDSLGPKPLWIRPGAEEHGVKNCYANPSQLGADRWAALIGARQRHTGSAVVVNAGTAITVDCLSADGLFLGGIILPGLRTMIESLAIKTAAVRVSSGDVHEFPTQTKDAVATGVTWAALGAIERMRAALINAGHGTPLCLLSGGAAPILQPYAPAPHQHVDELVLEGLLVLAQP